MDTRTRSIWKKLETMQIGPAGSAFTFEQRLARENGWTMAFAHRVVLEYKRFLLLCAVAGRPVTPSDEVDQAWHLHLVYTQHYWGQLCVHILGFPLHHGPTQGGDTERTRYRQQYLATLVAYQKVFDAVPPEDIWPTVDKRFENINYRRVNTQIHWVVPKLRLDSYVLPFFLIVIAGCMLLANLWLNSNSIRVIGFILVGSGALWALLVAISRNGHTGADGDMGCGGGACDGVHDTGCSGCSGCGGCGD